MIDVLCKRKEANKTQAKRNVLLPNPTPHATILFTWGPQQRSTKIIMIELGHQQRLMLSFYNDITQ